MSNIDLDKIQKSVDLGSSIDFLLISRRLNGDAFASNDEDRLDEIAGAQVFRNKGEACVSLRILVYIRALCWPAHLCIPPCPVPVGVPFSETSKFVPIPRRR